MAAMCFLGECRKSKGFGSLREVFYTKFKPIFISLGCDMTGNLDELSEDLRYNSLRR